METIVTILVTIISGMGFLLYKKSKETAQLKADQDLTSQSESSKLVGEKIEESQTEVDKLESELQTKPDDKDKDQFWDDYTKGL